MRRIALVLALVILASAARARIGGGDSYSGSSSSSSSSSSSNSGSSSYSGSTDYGSSSSSGSSSSGGGSPFMVFLLIGLVLVSGLAGGTNKSPTNILSVAPAPRAPVTLAGLREFDPNFSEIVFRDFCYSLFARVYEALGRARIDDFAPYLSLLVREELKQQAPAGLTGIDGIVIGSFAVTSFHIDKTKVEAEVDFEANYTEVMGREKQRWYVCERWKLTRARDLLSPRPEDAKAEHCPKCGAALATRTDGACLHCGTIVSDGSFHWFVALIDVEEKDQRSLALGGGGEVEPGLDRETINQLWIGREMKRFTDAHPSFTWEAFEERVETVAKQLQEAWTARDWNRARPLETDALFQTHRYWIDEYLRQDLRNIVDGYRIDRIEVAKVTSDAFHDAITVRLYASGADYTVDRTKNVVGGSRDVQREWSEYWTFIRGRGPASPGARVCPNCGGELASGQAAECKYCGGKVRTGEFPWILSSIEQDEAYRG